MKEPTSTLRVAVLGSGPAGSTFAGLLARQGAEVTLFDDGRRPELLVGESLIPVVMPILKRLAVDDEIAAIAQPKPGASFIWSPEDRFGFTFARFAPALPSFTYNVPRPAFDQVLSAKAADAGVRIVPARACLRRAAPDGEAELELAPESLAAAPDLRGRQPDLIVDATGRTRLIARMLDIPTRTGPRSDVAHFAHFEGFQWEEEPGQIVISRLSAGWSWCIPLPGRLSVGIVLGREDAARLGDTPEERLARAIATEPPLTRLAGNARRITPVATYSNYQLIAEQGYGRGWVLLGDALGFVDPMLSPGVSLALLSGESLADGLTPLIHRRSPAELTAAMARHSAAQMAHLNAWSKLVACFYDGTMGALMRSGRNWMDGGTHVVKRVLQDHIERQFALQASGVNITSRYASGLLHFLGRYGLRGENPADFAIR